MEIKNINLCLSSEKWSKLISTQHLYLRYAYFKLNWVSTLIWQTCCLIFMWYLTLTLHASHLKCGKCRNLRIKFSKINVFIILLFIQIYKTNIWLFFSLHKTLICEIETKGLFTFYCSPNFTLIFFVRIHIRACFTLKISGEGSHVWKSTLKNIDDIIEIFVWKQLTWTLNLSGECAPVKTLIFCAWGLCLEHHTLAALIQNICLCV